MNTIAERGAGRGARRRGARGLVASAIAMGVVALFPTPVRADEGTFSDITTFTCYGATAGDKAELEQLFGPNGEMPVATAWTLKLPPIVSAGATFPVLSEMHVTLPDELVDHIAGQGAKGIGLDAGGWTVEGWGDVTGEADVAFTPATLEIDTADFTFSGSEIVEDTFTAVSNDAIAEGVGHVGFSAFSMSLFAVYGDGNDDLDLACVAPGLEATIDVVHQEGDVADPADPVAHDPSFTG
jgi:hypothetical protein